jgi:hypothetical protein
VPTVLYRKCSTIHGRAEMSLSTICSAQDAVEHSNCPLTFGMVGIGGSLSLGRKNQTETLPKLCVFLFCLFPFCLFTINVLHLPNHLPQHAEEEFCVAGLQMKPPHQSADRTVK